MDLIKVELENLKVPLAVSEKDKKDTFLSAEKLDALRDEIEKDETFWRRKKIDLIKIEIENLLVPLEVSEKDQKDPFLTPEKLDAIREEIEADETAWRKHELKMDLIKIEIANLQVPLEVSEKDQKDPWLTPEKLKAIRDEIEKDETAWTRKKIDLIKIELENLMVPFPLREEDK